GRFGDVGRRGVFLHVQPDLAFERRIDVDRAGIFGDVGVVGAEAGHLLLLAPALYLVHVLADEVGDHPRAFSKLAFFAGFALRRRDRIADDEAALDRAIEDLVALVRA